MDQQEQNQKKTRKVPSTRHQHGWYSPDRKAAAVTAWLALGNAKLVEAVTKIPSGTIRAWKTEQWWKDLETGIREEESLQLDARLSKVVGKTLDLLEDRLENGDFMYDPKAGQLIRKPINADVINKVSTDMFDRRRILRGERKEQEVNQIQIQDHLVALAQQFVKIAKSQQPIIDVEVIDASPIRSNEKQILENDAIETSQNEGSQDLQCNEEEGRTESTPRQEEINEMPQLSFNWNHEGQSSSSPQDQGRTTGPVVGEGQSDQTVPGPILGTDEIDSAPRSDSCSSGFDGVEGQRSDSPQDGETVFLPNTQ